MFLGGTLSTISRFKWRNNPSCTEHHVVSKKILEFIKIQSLVVYVTFKCEAESHSSIFLPNFSRKIEGASASRVLLLKSAECIGRKQGSKYITSRKLFFVPSVFVQPWLSHLLSFLLYTQTTKKKQRLVLVYYEPNTTYLDFKQRKYLTWY